MLHRSTPILHRSTLATAAALALAVALAAPARADKAEPRGEEVPNVYVLRRGSVVAYEEVVREFLDSCRVRAHLLTLTDTNAASLSAAFRPGDVVFAVGQRAVEAMAGTRARVISALALHVPPGVVAADVVPPAEMALQALRKAHPRVERVGVIFSDASRAVVTRLSRLGPRIGVRIVPIHAADGPGAVRALRAAADDLDALWLAPDVNVLTPQLFQYALMLELSRGMPLIGVTRHHVQSGALLAYDSDPNAIGRQAADLTHQLLAGTPTRELLVSSREHTNIELTVNQDTARRLGSNLAALRLLEARMEP